MPPEESWSSYRDPRVEDEIEKLSQAGDEDDETIGEVIDRQIDDFMRRWNRIKPAIRSIELRKSSYRMHPYDKTAICKAEKVWQIYVGISTKGKGPSLSHRLFGVTASDAREMRFLNLVPKTGNRKVQDHDADVAARRSREHRINQGEA